MEKEAKAEVGDRGSSVTRVMMAMRVGLVAKLHLPAVPTMERNPMAETVQMMAQVTETARMMATVNLTVAMASTPLIHLPAMKRVMPTETAKCQAMKANRLINPKRFLQATTKETRQSRTRDRSRYSGY